MPLALTQSTAPTSPPITTAEAKLFLRVGNDAENDLIDGFVLAAVDAVQEELGRQLVTATFTWTLDRFPGSSRPWADDPWSPGRPRSRSEFVVPYPPLATVVSLKYFDVAGSQQTLSSSVYDVITTEAPGKIRLALDQTWPATDGRLGVIEIIYTAGAGVGDVPKAAKSAVYLVLGDLYEHRLVSSEKTLRENPAAMALLNAVGRVEVIG